MDEASCSMHNFAPDERADGTIYEANGVLLAPNKSADTVVPDFDSISAAKVHVPVSRARCT
jgi:hypothetical protein